MQKRNVWEIGSSNCRVIMGTFAGIERLILTSRKRLNLIEFQEDLKKALLASLQDLNPQSSWVKDPSGRHTNLAAVLDWPDSEDSDTETTNPEGDTPIAICE